MKKFIVNLIVRSEQLVSYEVESESEETLQKDLEMWSVADLGTCTEERSLHYEESVDSIIEVKEN